MRKILATLSACILLASGMVGFAACSEPEIPLEDTRPFMVALGDSWTAGVGSSWAHVGENGTEKQGAYVNIAGEIMGYRVVNEAVGGYTVERVQSQIDADTNGIRAQLKEADVIYLGVIGNNIYTHPQVSEILAQAEEGVFTILDGIIGTLKIKWSDLIYTIRELNPDCELLVHNIISMGDETGTGEGATGSDRAFVRLHERVVQAYLDDDPDAYRIVSLAAQNMQTDCSNNDTHPNDRYHMRLALSLYERFKEFSLYTAEESVVLQNLKSYSRTLFEGFDLFMEQMAADGTLTSEAAAAAKIDLDAYSAEVETLDTVPKVAEVYYETFSSHDPRPYLG